MPMFSVCFPSSSRYWLWLITQLPAQIPLSQKGFLQPHTHLVSLPQGTGAWSEFISFPCLCFWFFLSCFPCSRCRESKSSPPHHQHTLSVWWHRTTRSVRSQDGGDSIRCHSLWPSTQCCSVLWHRGQAEVMRLWGKYGSHSKASTDAQPFPVGHG